MSDSEINADIIGQLVDRGLVNKDILDRIVSAESSGNPEAVSPKGATGLMQLMPATAAEEAKKLGMDNYDLKNPEDNKKLGTAYFKEQMQKYGDPSLALAAYNAGPGTVDKALARHGDTYEAIASALPAETRNYVAKITGTPIPTSSPEPTPQAEPAPAPDMTSTPAPTQTPYPTVDPNSPPPVVAEAPPPILPIEQRPDAGPVADSNVAPQTPAVGPQVPQVDPQTALAAAGEAAQQGEPQTVVGSLAAGQEAQAQDPTLANAFGAQSAGAMQAGQAAITGAQQKATEYRQYAQDIAREGVDYTEKRQKAEAATQADLERYRQKVIAFGNASIDPNRIFKGANTFSTILLGIGSALQAAAGNTQQATQIIDNAIDRDINLQKAAIDIKKQDVSNESSLMAANHNQLRSIDEAESQTRAQMYAKSAATINQIAANQNSETAKANLLTISGTLQQKQLDEEAKFAKLRGDANAMAALQSPTIGFDKAETALASLPMNGAGKFVVQQDGKPIGMAQDPNKMNIVVQTRSIINENLKNLRDLYKDSTLGIPLDPTKAELANTYIARIKENLANAQKNGSRMARVLQKSFDQQLPDDLFSAGGGAFGRAVKGAFIQTGFAADPLQKINALQKETDDQFLIDAQNLVKNPTPAFQKQLIALMSKKGSLPGDKVLPQ